MLGRVPVHIVGMYPGSLGLTDRARAVLCRAQAVAGGKRMLMSLDALSTADCPIRPDKLIPLGGDLDGSIERIRQLSRTMRVCVLADGDPLFFGLGRKLVDALGDEAVIILPNVTTLQVAAARLKTPWHDIPAISLHGRDDYFPLFSALTRYDSVAVFTDAVNSPTAIAEALLTKGIEGLSMTVLEDLDTPQERIRTLTLEEIWDCDFSSLNLVLLTRHYPPETQLHLGMPDHYYLHEADCITKQAVRASGLAMLAVHPESVIWDLGSGSGSVAIEASHLAWRGRVFAVEKNRRRASMIRENVRRFGAWLVEPLRGEMPECLDELPNPDRIFIGGGLGGKEGRGLAILTEACNRLLSGGRLVAHCVLLDTLQQTKAFLEEQGWNFGVTQLQASTADRLGGDLHFKAQNPVFIIWAEKP